MFETSTERPLLLRMSGKAASSVSRQRMDDGLMHRRVERARRIALDQQSESLDRSLEGLESAHNYYSWIASLMHSKMTGRVLELGSGTGTFTKVLSRTAASVDALEPSPHSFGELCRATEGLKNVTPLLGTLEVLAGQESSHYDNAVLINVLEHIENDADCLRELARLIRPGGGLAVWVPAHEFLYSNFDFRLGHYRRYNLRELRDLACDAGFEVDQIEYRNAPGALAWWVVAKVARSEPTGSGLALLWDRVIVKAVASVERHVRFPFGQSLLLTASIPE